MLEAIHTCVGSYPFHKHNVLVAYHNTICYRLSIKNYKLVKEKNAVFKVRNENVRYSLTTHLRPLRDGSLKFFKKYFDSVRMASLSCQMYRSSVPSVQYVGTCIRLAQNLQHSFVSFHSCYMQWCHTFALRSKIKNRIKNYVKNTIPIIFTK